MTEKKKYWVSGTEHRGVDKDFLAESPQEAAKEFYGWFGIDPEWITTDGEPDWEVVGSCESCSVFIFDDDEITYFTDSDGLMLCDNCFEPTVRPEE